MRGGRHGLLLFGHCRPRLSSRFESGASSSERFRASWLPRLPWARAAVAFRTAATAAAREMRAERGEDANKAPRLSGAAPWRVLGTALVARRPPPLAGAATEIVDVGHATILAHGIFSKALRSASGRNGPGTSGWPPMAGRPRSGPDGSRPPHSALGGPPRTHSRRVVDARVGLSLGTPRRGAGFRGHHDPDRAPSAGAAWTSRRNRRIGRPHALWPDHIICSDRAPVDGAPPELEGGPLAALVPGERARVARASPSHIRTSTPDRAGRSRYVRRRQGLSNPPACGRGAPRARRRRSCATTANPAAAPPTRPATSKPR